MSSSRKKSRAASAGEAMELAAKPEPALTYAARDSFAFVETPDAPVPAIVKAVPKQPVIAPIAGPAFKFTASTTLFGDYDALTAFGNGNVEAVAKAGAIVAKGFEEISQSVVELGQRNLESSVALAKAAFGMTTLRQLVDLQTGFAKDSFERLVAEGSRLSDISFKTADAAMKPLKARVAQAIEKLSTAAA